MMHNPLKGGLNLDIFGVYPMGISAWEGAGGKIFGLYAPFWLCFLVNLKENQNSILHGMVIVAREPDLMLSNSNKFLIKL